MDSSFKKKTMQRPLTAAGLLLSTLFVAGVALGLLSAGCSSGDLPRVSGSGLPVEPPSDPDTSADQYGTSQSGLASSSAKPTLNGGGATATTEAGNTATQRTAAQNGQPAEAQNAEPVDAPKVVSKTQLPPKSEVEVISFDDLNIGMQPDAKFRPIMLEFNDGRVKELFGTRVNLAGYMDPTDTLDGVTEFILLRNLECKFGPGGQADHLVHVVMQNELTTSFTDKVVYVEGELVLSEFPKDSPSTWSIYDIKATRVSLKAPSRAR